MPTVDYAKRSFYKGETLWSRNWREKKATRNLSPLDKSRNLVIYFGLLIIDQMEDAGDVDKNTLEIAQLIVGYFQRE